MLINEHGFPRSARLLLAVDFSRVFKKPVRLTDRHFTILARPNNKDQARLGLAIAKKKVRLAVDRNRLKRLIRDSFRHHYNSMPEVDIVVMVKPGSAQQSNQVLLAALETHWKKLS